jgi:hypothetical protein
MYCTRACSTRLGNTHREYSKLVSLRTISIPPVMYDFYYERLLGDASKFKPRAGTRYLELWDQGNGSPVRCEEGELHESQISPWLHKVMPETIQAPEAGGKSSTSRLRLLIGSPEVHENDAQIIELPFSPDTFEQIRSAWTLPTEFLRMLLSTLPIRTSFSFNSLAGDPEQIVLMLRGGRSRDWNYCLALTHDIATGITCAMIQGLEAHEIELLVQCLKSSREHVEKPMLLPLYLTELKTHFFAVLLEKRAVSLEAIEKETGMSHGFSNDPKRNQRLDADRQQDLAKVDFEPITQKLTGLTGTLAFCDLTFQANRQDLDLIIATARKTPNARTSHKQSTNHDETRPDPDQRANYLKNLISGAQAHRSVLLERTKAQVQTVYSMIGQRDNKLNIETATAARRDSNAMRIIAAVTLVFLPGTFTATLFSTTFFNFQNQTSNVVSWWLWLYFVVTVVLTLAVLVGWYYLEKKQNRTLSQSLNIASAGRAVVRNDEEAVLMSEKESLQPASDIVMSGSSRAAEVRSYTKNDNDLGARLWTNWMAAGWHGHH